MLQKIEAIRKKPKDIRNRYAFWSAFFITFIIAAFWLTSVPARLSVLTNTPVPEKEKIQGGFSRSFSSLKASLFDSTQKLQEIEIQIESEVVVPKEDSGIIDFNTFFSTTSTSTEKVTPEAVPAARKVLIGTSSKDSSDTVSTQE